MPSYFDIERIVKLQCIPRLLNFMFFTSYFSTLSIYLILQRMGGLFVFGIVVMYHKNICESSAFPFPSFLNFPTLKKGTFLSVFIYSLFLPLYRINKCKTISWDLTVQFDTRNIYFFHLSLVYFSAVCRVYTYR